MKTIKTVDVMLIDEDDNILLIRRAKPPFEDKFVLPGGHVEKGEQLQQAAARELMEEVGIEVSPHDLHFLCRLDTIGRDPRPGRRVSHVFWMRVSSQVLAMAHAGTDAQSVDIIALRNLCAEAIGFDHFVAIERFRRRTSSL